MAEGTYSTQTQGTMLMTSLSKISTLSAIALVLAACGGEKKEEAPAAAPPTAAAAPAAVPQGQYAVCQTCHQADGNGVPNAFPPLAGSEIATGPSEVPIAIVLHGLQGPLTVHGTTYNGQMAAWGQFSDDDIAATLTYVRSSWGNAAPAVTAAEVATVRAATASRTTPWTWEELQAAKLK
jgi:mono/diheme cytochrome c family protein